MGKYNNHYTINLPVEDSATRKKKEGKNSRTKPKQTLKAPSQHLESRIEKRKVASSMGDPVMVGQLHVRVLVFFGCRLHLGTAQPVAARSLWPGARYPWTCIL